VPTVTCSGNGSGKNHGWLRWAGSKARALDVLRDRFESAIYDLYVEPFVGAATVFLNLTNSHRAVLADTNEDLIAFFSHVKRDPEKVWRALTTFPTSVSKDYYYSTRTKFNLLPSGLKRASTFFFLNRTCFNGIYRVNCKGEFNVPKGSRRTFRYPSLQELSSIALKLQRADLVCCDFQSTASLARPGVLYYLDPPYTGNGYDRYSWPPFRGEDIDRLACFVSAIRAQGASVIASYSGAKRPPFVPMDFDLKRFKVFRSISSDGTRGRKAEVCASALDAMQPSQWSQGAAE
jgi:DNA adenine methylase